VTTRTIVHLMRHGEVFNPEGVLYGRLPGYVLAERGLVMAEATAKFLAGEGETTEGEAAPRRDIVAITASPLVRAQQTAEASSKRFDLPIASDDDLIEADSKFVGHKVDGAFLRKPQQ
jgi:broad specificity phosphatase PhoE